MSTRTRTLRRCNSQCLFGRGETHRFLARVVGTTVWEAQTSGFTNGDFGMFNLGNSPVQGLGVFNMQNHSFGVGVFHRPLVCHRWSFQAPLNTRLHDTVLISTLALEVTTILCSSPPARIYHPQLIPVHDFEYQFILPFRRHSWS